MDVIKVDGGLIITCDFPMGKSEDFVTSIEENNSTHKNELLVSGTRKLYYYKVPPLSLFCLCYMCIYYRWIEIE